MIRLLYGVAIAAVGCASPQTGMPMEQVEKLLSDQEAHCDSLLAVEREMRAYAEGDSVDSSTTILALEAVSSGNARCAACLLNTELDARLAAAERFVAGDAPPDAIAAHQSSIEFMRQYRVEHSFDPGKCKGACAAPE